MTVTTLARRIAQALGNEPADLVIRGARILDTATGAIESGDVAITGDTIVGTRESYRGRQEIDARGRILVPGFIDTHLHIESSLVTPAEFEKGVLPRGTTTAICDPHEIANVLGVDGIRYFLAAAPHPRDDPARQSQLLRAGDRARDVGGPPRGRRSRGAGRRSGRPGARRGHELPGRPRRRSGPAGEARPLRPRPCRRPCPAARGQGAERLSRHRHPHRSRMHPARRGGREARQGHVHPDARGLGGEERRHARAAALGPDLVRASPSAPTTATRSRSPRKAISTPPSATRSVPARRPSPPTVRRRWVPP